MVGLYPHCDDVIAGFCTVPVDQPGLQDIPSERCNFLQREFSGWTGLAHEIMHNILDPENMWSDDMLEVRLSAAGTSSNPHSHSRQARSLTLSLVVQLDLEAEKRPMYNGRVVLVGDSGHAVLPTAGTGATLAMESAAVLAEELCRSTPSYRDIQHTLLMWQMRRGPRIARVREEGNLLATAITWTNPLAVFYRNYMAASLPGNYFSDSMMKLLYDPI